MPRLLPFFLSALFALVLCVACPCPADAAGHKVALRTLGLWLPEKDLRLDVNVWYPTIRQPRSLEYGAWKVQASLAGKPVEGRFPLVLLSHASPATRFSYHDTASRLAAQGHVVAAPTHAHDCLDDMSLYLTWKQLQTRVAELSATIDLVLSTPELAPIVDGKRIGVLGFEAGGTAALLLGGALPDCTSWAGYCSNAVKGDIYCNPWALERMNEICTHLPLKHSLADTRIKAVVAVAPAFGMLFGQTGFRYFYPPALVVGAGQERQHSARHHAASIARRMGGKAGYVELAEADGAAFMAPCPPALSAEMPNICQSVSAATRSKVHERLHDLLESFFGQHLGNEGMVLTIPAPPELTPPAPPPLVGPPRPAGKRPR